MARPNAQNSGTPYFRALRSWLCRGVETGDGVDQEAADVPTPIKCVRRSCVHIAAVAKASCPSSRGGRQCCDQCRRSLARKGCLRLTLPD